MAFKVHTFGAPRTSVMERYPGTNEEVFTIGEAVVVTAGDFIKVAATAIPTHIMNESATGDGVTLLSAIKVTSLDEFETVATAAPDCGETVTIHTDGLSVTDTTVNGVFKTSYVGSGDTPVVRGRFPGA